jgi:hypothetical protein
MADRSLRQGVGGRIVVNQAAIVAKTDHLVMAGMGPKAERRLQSGTASTTDIGAEGVAWVDAARREAGPTAREWMLSLSQYTADMLSSCDQLGHHR